MPRTLTKADVQFSSAYIFTETDQKGVERVYVNVGYTITTDEGETITRDLHRHELTGGQKARIRNALTSLRSAITAKEGI